MLALNSNNSSCLKAVIEVINGFIHLHFCNIENINFKRMTLLHTHTLFIEVNKLASFQEKTTVTVVPGAFCI